MVAWLVRDRSCAAARRAAMLASACAVGLVLAACGGGDRPSAPVSTGNSAAEPATPTAQSQPAPPSAVAQQPARAPEPQTPPAVDPARSELAADEARVWVTQDRGEVLVASGVAPAGLTALQALDRVADVETRYGGRYVQAVDGLEGSLERQRDWFFILNGIEPDVGAAEVRVHAGDVVWFDLRSWTDPAGHPAVRVGAFPAPFSAGWNGARAPVVVRGPPELEDARAALAALLERGGDGAPHTFELAVVSGETGARLTASMGDRNGSPVTFRLAGSAAGVRETALALARDPSLVAHRYDARFDDAGRLLG